MRIIRRRKGAVAASLLACGLLTGCSLITSVDGLTGGTSPTDTSPPFGPKSADGGAEGSVLHPTDAGDALGTAQDGDASTAADASLADAAWTDAPTVDAGGADAALSDARTVDAGKVDAGIDAGPSNFCAGLVPRSLFCDDFDEGQSVTSGWDHIGSLNGTTSIDSAAATSPPAALKESVSALPAGASVDIGAYKSFPSFAAKALQMTYVFDVYVDVIDQTHTAPAVAAALVLYDAAGATWQVQLALTYTGSSIAVRTPEWWAASGGSPSGYTEHLVNATLTVKRWTRVSMQLSMPSAAGGAATLQLALDGTTVETASLKVTTSNATPQMILGLSYVQSPSDSWIVRYDDVTLDAKAL